MGTHQELEMFGSQPAYPEKLLHKKESLQNQLINIRVELSQASTVIPSERPIEDMSPCFLAQRAKHSGILDNGQLQGGMWEGRLAN